MPWVHRPGALLVKRPKRLLKARRRATVHDIRIVATAFLDGEDVPIVEVTRSEGVPQMTLDRAIGDLTGLREWVRAIRPDDAPDVARAIDPDPAALTDELRSVLATHKPEVLALLGSGPHCPAESPPDGPHGPGPAAMWTTNVDHAPSPQPHEGAWGAEQGSDPPPWSGPHGPHSSGIGHGGLLSRAGARVALSETIPPPSRMGCDGNPHVLAGINVDHVDHSPPWRRPAALGRFPVEARQRWADRCAELEAEGVPYPEHEHLALVELFPSAPTDPEPDGDQVDDQVDPSRGVTLAQLGAGLEHHRLFVRKR